MISRYEFEVLSHIAETGKAGENIRELADGLCLSAGTVERALEALAGQGFLCTCSSGGYAVTDAGLEALEPYRVKRAVIVAAGFGSRMMPVTADRPKPMVTVKGVRIIDTLLDALAAAGIREITVVGGYRFEKLKELTEKYPFLTLAENKEYDTANNISSAMAALDAVRDGCYFCEADLYISNPRVIRKYQYASNILGSYSMETDDWSFRMDGGYLTDYRKGNTYCYNYYGISYWTAEDCDKLRQDFAEVYRREDGKQYFWEFVPFVLKKERYRVEIRPCRKQDILEIDSYEELAQLDSAYR